MGGELVHVQAVSSQQLSVELVHLELHSDQVLDLFGFLELRVLGPHRLQHALQLRQLRGDSRFLSLQVIVKFICSQMHC